MKKQTIAIIRLLSLSLLSAFILAACNNCPPCPPCGGNEIAQKEPKDNVTKSFATAKPVAIADPTKLTFSFSATAARITIKYDKDTISIDSVKTSFYQWSTYFDTNNNLYFVDQPVAKYDTLGIVGLANDGDIKVNISNQSGVIYILGTGDLRDSQHTPSPGFKQNITNSNQDNKNNIVVTINSKTFVETNN